MSSIPKVLSRLGLSIADITPSGGDRDRISRLFTTKVADTLSTLLRTTFGVAFDCSKQFYQQAPRSTMLAAQTRIILYLCTKWPIESSDTWRQEHRNHAEVIRFLISAHPHYTYEGTESAMDDQEAVIDPVVPSAALAAVQFDFLKLRIDEEIAHHEANGTVDEFKANIKAVAETAMRDRILGIPAASFAGPLLSAIVDEPDKCTLQKCAMHISTLVVAETGRPSTFDSRCELIASQLNNALGTTICLNESSSPVKRPTLSSSLLHLLATTPGEDHVALSIVRNPASCIASSHDRVQFIARQELGQRIRHRQESLVDAVARMTLCDAHDGHMCRLCNQLR